MRSTREQAAGNRARIVKAAARLFRAKGYEAVGIADVMKAAGMTQGGFYKHFASKEALAVEAWAAGFEKAAALWRERGVGDRPVASLVDFYLANAPDEYRCPMAAHGEDAGRLAADSALRTAFVDGAHTLFETFLDASRNVADDDLRLLFAAMLGANLLKRVAGDEPWVRELVDTVRRRAAPAPAH